MPLSRFCEWDYGIAASRFAGFSHYAPQPELFALTRLMPQTSRLTPFLFYQRIHFGPQLWKMNSNYSPDTFI
jgi:hypothetical protein